MVKATRVYPAFYDAYFAEKICKNPSLLWFLSDTWKRQKLKICNKKFRYPAQKNL